MAPTSKNIPLIRMICAASFDIARDLTRAPLGQHRELQRAGIAVVFARPVEHGPAVPYLRANTGLLAASVGRSACGLYRYRVGQRARGPGFGLP